MLRTRATVTLSGSRAGAAGALTAAPLLGALAAGGAAAGAAGLAAGAQPARASSVRPSARASVERRCIVLSREPVLTGRGRHGRPGARRQPRGRPMGAIIAPW